jgi:hypothetical protein
MLYFSPCRTFVDLLEFRFAYCWDQFGLAGARGDPEIFNRCVRDTFSNESVQKRINETVISCWSFNQESPYMWETYARSEPAIIVTLKKDDLSALVKHKHGKDSVSGAVRYHFQPSCVFPEFITSTDDPQWEKDYDLFFHKHQFYGFENEFRAVIFGPAEAVKLPLPNGMVQEITLSLHARVEASLVTALKRQFGERVQESRLHWSFEAPKIVTIEDYMTDERTAKTPEMITWFEKLKSLKAQNQTRGWNDPKAPPIPKEQIQIGKQILEIEKRLKLAIEETKKPQTFES